MIDTATTPDADTPSSGPSTDDATRAAAPAPTGIRKWGARLAVGLAASSTLVWIGAIVYGAVGDYHLSGWLKDRTFPKAAEPICKKAMTDLKAFPQAYESRTPQDRAVVVRETTARLDRMLTDLRVVVPDTADAKWINMWIDDWGTHLSDRLDFADRLDAKGAGEEFFETTKANVQISKSLDAYAENNQMLSCETPGDV